MAVVVRLAGAFALVAFLFLCAYGCGLDTNGVATGLDDAGIDAAACVPDCAAGTHCVNGACVCDGTSCDGCCNGNACVTTAGQSANACGKAGAACSGCGGATPTCVGGACVAKCGGPGDSACATGCCKSGACAAGDTANACGATGSCNDCSASALGHACVAGACGCNGDADCPSGGRCNTTSHSCTSCGPGNCAGCCDAQSGACVTASPTACGQNGATCSACAAGQTCTGGACACDPSTCQGCCNGATCVPAANETATACGKNGATCTACPSGQSCSNGSCGCDATSCPNGCCNGGVCVPYASQNANSCGHAGAACAACAGGQSCSSGVCGCDATSCPNGCCNNGVCVPFASQNNGACGNAGASCAACANGSVCTNGSCGCDATTCANGCCNNGVCVPQGSQTNGECGTGGAACAPCSGLTPTCAGGSCTATCGGGGNGTCTGGCCAGNACATGTANNACGTNGSACVDCTTSALGHACRAGACGCNSSADCPNNGACDTTTHTCGTCNQTTCPNGCCDANGVCQTGSANTACGAGGVACAACASGQSCVAHACACDASCNGCCAGTTCVATGSESNGQCGSGGATCASCAANTQGIACVSGHCGCNAASDCPSGSVCNSSTKQCVAGGQCSTGACNGCCNGTGACVAGGATNACGAGGGACADCTASVPVCETTPACTSGACTYTPSPGGTSCSTAFCTVGQTCNGSGTCGGGTPRDCTGGDVCKSCTCSNAGAGSCNCSTRTANPQSTLKATASCLTAGTGAETAIVLTLVDASGQPAKGATVTFNSTNAGVTWVEPNVVEVSNPPGTYYRTLKALGSSGSTTISAGVSFCGGSTVIASSVNVSFAAPAASTGYGGAAFQGVAGCTPVGGHVRVKVIAQETGAPIAGASVLVGSSAGTPFVSSASSLFPTPSATGANTATTDASGVAEFLDFGTALAGPQIVTAAASGRANVTTYHFNGADQVLALPLRRPTRTTYRYTNGTASPIPSRPDCTWLQAGFALQDSTLDQIAQFDLSTIVGPNKCVNTGLGGTQVLPENVYAPNQSIGTSQFLCLANINTTWSASVVSGSRELDMPFVRIPVSAVQSGNLVTMIQQAVYQSAAYQAQTVGGAVSGDSLPLSPTYANKVTFNFSNIPSQSDIVGLTLADYGGGDGTGALGIGGLQIHKYNDTGSSIAVPVAATTGAPSGSRLLGALVASYLSLVTGRTIPTDLVNAGSAALVRDGASGSPPFTSTANSTINVSSFLAFPPAIVSGGTTFTFGDATNAGQSPQYSVSTLAIKHTTWLPQQSCETTPSKTVVTYPQWIVIRPHANDAASCSGLNPAQASCEAFTLPTLPLGFPQSSGGTQQQSGFEPYVGSAAACSASNACKLASESCVVPTGTTLAAQCMGNDGTYNFTEQYTWYLEDRVLGDAPSAIAVGAADFTQWKPGLTLEASNQTSW